MNFNTDHIIANQELAASMASVLLPEARHIPKGKTVKYDGEGRMMIVDDPDYMTEDGMFRKHRKKNTDKRPKVKRKKNKKTHRK